MKIALATPLYPPESGGPATYAKLLKEHLGGDRGGEVVCLVKFSDVRHLPSSIRHLRYFWLVLEAARGAQVVLALDPVSTGLPALLAARILGKPFVVKIVGDFAWEQGRQRFGITSSLDAFVLQKKLPFSVQVLRSVETFVAKHAKRVIVPSHYLKGIVNAWGIPEDKISVIYNSIELPELAPQEKSLSSRVVSVGRLVPWKGFEGVIDAVAAIRERADEKLTSTTLTIIGDGPDEDVLKAKGSALLGDAITFSGRLANVETLQTIQQSSVLVLNSSYEGLSHLLIEALSVGCAIIASDAGGNPELIQHEMNGLLVPVGDTVALTNALERILSDEELAARLRAAAKESAKRFNVSTMCAETVALLESV
jgi:glycosyltransferase involved in cell wall biosynthesis